MTNKERAALAKRALDAAATTPDTPETDIIDLVANLLHLAHRECLDSDSIIRIAKNHFEHEVEGANNK